MRIPSRNENVRRIVHEDRKVDRRTLSIPLQCNEQFVRWISEATSLGYDIEYALAREADTKLVSSINSITDNSNLRGILLHEAYNGLRFDRTIGSLLSMSL